MRRPPAVLPLALLVAALVLVLPACGDDAGTAEPVTAETSSATTEGSTATDAGPPPTEPAEETTTAADDPAQRITEVWLVHAGFLRLGWRLAPESEGVARVAVESLLAEAGLTAIPPRTELLDVAVEGDRATVDLSGPLRTGERGRLGLAQIVYTVTQFENVSEVEVLARGEPLAGLAGAHTRAELEDLLAPVVVESPTGLEAVESPVVVSGTANTFEANVRIEVIGETGEPLASTFATATCGSGCRGDFRKAVPVRVAQPTSATLVVSEDDPSGGEGRPPYRHEIPLLIQPAR